MLHIISSAFAIGRERRSRPLLASAFVVVAPIPLVALAFGWADSANVSHEASVEPWLLLAFALCALHVVVTFFGGGMYTAFEIVAGHETGAMRAVRHAYRRAPAVLGIVLLQQLVVGAVVAVFQLLAIPMVGLGMAGFVIVLLLFGVPGFVFTTRITLRYLMVAPFCLVVEGLGIRDAIRRTDTLLAAAPGRLVALFIFWICFLAAVVIPFAIAMNAADRSGSAIVEAAAAGIAIGWVILSAVFLWLVLAVHFDSLLKSETVRSQRPVLGGPVRVEPAEAGQWSGGGIQQCPGCGTRVLPRPDGVCPSCLRAFVKT